VFELTTSKEKEAEVTASVEVVFQTETPDGIKIRAVIGDGGLPQGAVPVDDPTLEEAYLAFMAARGRAAAAQEEVVP
jgi:hypothetical protein